MIITPRYECKVTLPLEVTDLCNRVWLMSEPFIYKMLVDLWPALSDSQPADTESWLYAASGVWLCLRHGTWPQALLLRHRWPASSDAAGMCLPYKNCLLASCSYFLRDKTANRQQRPWPQAVRLLGFLFCFYKLWYFCSSDLQVSLDPYFPLFPFL